MTEQVEQTEQPTLGDNIVQHLAELFVFIAKLEPIKATKTKPAALKLTQESAMQMLQHLNATANLLGAEIQIETNDDGNTVVAVRPVATEPEITVTSEPVNAV